MIEQPWNWCMFTMAWGLKVASTLSTASEVRTSILSKSNWDCRTDADSCRHIMFPFCSSLIYLNTKHSSRSIQENEVNTTCISPPFITRVTDLSISLYWFLKAERPRIRPFLLIKYSFMVSHSDSSPTFGLHP